MLLLRGAKGKPDARSARPMAAKASMFPIVRPRCGGEGGSS